MHFTFSVLFNFLPWLSSLGMGALPFLQLLFCSLWFLYVVCGITLGDQEGVGILVFCRCCLEEYHDDWMD